MAVKVGMVSLGCPKNQMDAELMLASLREAGYELTSDAESADVVVVNTCGFIEDAKREAIENILEFAKLKEEGRIRKLVVTGCLAQRYREELAREIPECDAVLGLGANADIARAVGEVLRGESVVSFPPLSRWKTDGRRVQTTPSYFAYLRVADGCDNRCAYCAIPSIRGPLRSRSEEDILEEAGVLARNGVRELNLVAQDLTLYGADKTGESRLAELVQKLCRIDGIEWIRLLYCYPDHITEPLLDVIAGEKKVVKYLDIPLQHADGEVLRAMGRQGDAESLARLLSHIRRRVPGIVLRTTVMVGFPGETGRAFETLCAFLRDVRFEWLGCFPFSAEEGTPAEKMPRQIPQKVKERRRDTVMSRQAEITGEWLSSLVGRRVEVLAEGFDRCAGCWFGRAAFQAPDIDGKVFFSARGAEVAPGDLVSVDVTDTMDWDVLGELCPADRGEKHESA